ncbi:SDR family NAD(P)-dependent oxidoreductase [Marinibaculum pumilum]|uniref:SDR family NAD(P)-dependent oxidoreductase n=1 Tax=Marinibaculum pumilum TaxID=1766165 RepID=A0ABV7L4X6_9PROT
MSTILAGSAALVSGADRGIGAGIARRLAEAGASVAIGYRRGRDGAETLAADLTATGLSARAVPLDVVDRASVQAAVAATVEAFGGLHILVNNAGYLNRVDFAEIDPEDWDHTLAVNLRGPFLLCQAVLPHLKAAGRRGRIINISSMGGQFGGTKAVPYAASKAALISLTKSLARLYAGDGMTVNAIAPGLIRTEMMAAVVTPEEEAQAIADVPLHEIGLPGDIAEAALYLAAESGRYVTGHVLNVNGGIHIGAGM